MKHRSFSRKARFHFGVNLSDRPITDIAERNRKEHAWADIAACIHIHHLVAGGAAEMFFPLKMSEIIDRHSPSLVVAVLQTAQFQSLFLRYDRIFVPVTFDRRLRFAQPSLIDIEPLQKLNEILRPGYSGSSFVRVCRDADVHAAEVLENSIAFSAVRNAPGYPRTPSCTSSDQWSRLTDTE